MSAEILSKIWSHISSVCNVEEMLGNGIQERQLDWDSSIMPFPSLSAGVGATSSKLGVSPAICHIREITLRGRQDNKLFGVRTRVGWGRQINRGWQRKELGTVSKRNKDHVGEEKERRRRGGRSQ